MSSVEVLICVTLIAFSAFLSGSEIAIFSLSRFQLRSLKENFRPIHRKIKSLLNDPSGLLITILVLNEMVNIALSSIIAHFIARSPMAIPKNLNGTSPWTLRIFLDIAITTPIILFFCEITPKVIAAKINQLVASLAINPLSLIYSFFKPVRVSIKFFLNFLVNVTSTNEITHKRYSSRKNRILKESDFLLMLEEGHKEGAIQEIELELIQNVFELDTLFVENVSTPLSQILSLSASTTVKEALAVIRSQNYSRIPVYGNSKKDIVGILYSKDLLRSKLQEDSSAVTLATLMRKPFFVSTGMKLSALFRKFKQQKIHMAIVKNVSGEATAIVTMSDILESLFEDLFTEDELNGVKSHSHEERK